MAGVNVEAAVLIDVLTPPGKAVTVAFGTKEADAVGLKLGTFVFRPSPEGLNSLTFVDMGTELITLFSACPAAKFGCCC